MTEIKQTSTTKTDRRPDCVTEIRMGNSVLTVSGFFKQGATDTAADNSVTESVQSHAMSMCVCPTQRTHGPSFLVWV